jgi:hypothetical protein
VRTNLPSIFYLDGLVAHAQARDIHAFFGQGASVDLGSDPPLLLITIE